MHMRVKTVTSMGITLAHVAEPSRLNDARLTQVEELFTTIPAS